MPHVRADYGKHVVLDHGEIVTSSSSINVDVTLPMASAALGDGSLIQLDNEEAPEWASPGATKFSGPVDDSCFDTPPPVNTIAVGDSGSSLYIKTDDHPQSVWKKASIA